MAESTGFMALRLLLADHDWHVDDSEPDTERLYSPGGYVTLTYTAPTVLIKFPDFYSGDTVRMEIKTWTLGTIVDLAVHVQMMTRALNQLRPGAQ